MDSKLSRYRWFLLALFVLALSVRVIRLDWDQLHFFHPDERAVAYAVQRLSFSPLQLNPQFFAYGSLPFYVTKATTSALSYLDRWYAGYDGVIMTGRALSGVWGALTCVLLALLGWRLYGPRTGLLAGFFLAFSVSHVQNSHYATNDVALSFLVLLVLYFLLDILETGRARSYLAAGFTIGLAAATKFSAMPILLPLGLTVLARMRTERRFLAPMACGAGAIVMLALGFALGQPYAILDYQAYIQDIIEQSNMVRNAGLYPYTNQYIGVPKYLYELRELILWGMGPLLGITAVVATASRCGRALRHFRVAEIVLLAWVIPFFLISGWFDVKFPRYLLPIYPLLCLWAAVWLVEWADRRRAGRIARGVVVAGTVLATLAFMSIYTKPHTVVRASEWLYDNVRPGAKILTQHWDEGFPMPLPGKNASAYEVVPLPYYEPDSPSKIAQLSQELAAADYLAFQTKRLYGAITRAPEKFPLTNAYFYLLFSGDLGYTLIQEVASRPQLLGIELPSELADESFSVYDHPKVLIFKNTERLSAGAIQNKVLRGVPSQPLTRSDLLLAGVDGEQSFMPASEPLSIRSSLLATLLCVLLLELIGCATYALLRPAITPRPGLYGLSKAAGVLLFAYLPWLAVSIGWLPFTQGTAVGSAAVLIGLGVIAHLRRSDAPWPRGEIVATEAIFWSAFLFFLLVRAFNPEIFWGEKPMDFSFLNAMYRTTVLPPPEPWFAGSPLHYTYFGYFVVAVFGKALAIHPAVMFNLGIAMAAALTVAAVMGAGTALGRRWQVGVIAAFLATLTGNLAGLREYLDRQTFNFDYFWATSRVIRDTINEFPLWTFLFADLHAHMMVMPFTVGFVGFVILWTQRRGKVSDHVPIASAPTLLFLLALFFGAIAVTNGWSMPTYATLLPAILVVHWLATHEWTGFFGFLASAIGRVLLPTATVLGGAFLLIRPFYWYYSPPDVRWGWEHIQFAQPYDYFTIFGLFLVALTPFFFAAWRRLLAQGRPRLGWPRRLAIVVVVTGLALALVDLGALARLELQQAASIRIFAALLAVLGIFVTLHPGTPARHRLPLALGTFAVGVTAGCDFVFVWDRMNTVFKFYLEAWFLLALAAAAALWELWTRGTARGVGRAVWLTGVAVAVALSLFTAATDVYGVLTTDRVETPKPTLDGMAYLENRSPQELAAFEWLNRTVRGIPVLVEAYGPSYQDYTRVSMNTGLPTVLGWDYHVYQRAHTWPEINARKNDIETIYTSDTEAKVAKILDRYHAALVYVGPVERRVYNGGNLPNFKKWDELLTPVYQNTAVTIFAVNGQFAGGVPVTTIEEVSVEGVEEASQQPAGHLQQPRGVATDAAGNIYVCDFGNNRIQKFDTLLEVVGSWGSRGDLPGDFKDPCAADVGPDQNVYVADTWNQRVQVFDAEGNYLREFSGGFYGPRGVGVDPKTGDVYVADTGNHRIVQFDSEGKKTREWGGKGDAPGKLFEPMGVAVDDDGNVYVADNGNGRLQIFMRDGSLIRTFAVDGWQSAVYSEPDVTVDAQGRIWVTVPQAKEIRSYSQDGELLVTVKHDEIPQARFDTPMGIDVDAASGSLIVTDLNHRVLRIPDVLKR